MLKIYVYDTKVSCPAFTLSKICLFFACSLIRLNLNKSLIVQCFHGPWQQQSGTTKCGVFVYKQ